MLVSRHVAEPFLRLPRAEPGGPHLVEDVGHVLLAAGLLGVAQLRRVPARQQTLVPNQRHALIRDLVALEVDLVVGTTWKRTGWLRKSHTNGFPSITWRDGTKRATLNTAASLTVKNGKIKLPVLLRREDF